MVSVLSSAELSSFLKCRVVFFLKYKVVSFFQVHSCLLFFKFRVVFFFQDINECLTEPCENYVLCNNTEGSYQCICKPGYTGQTCAEPTCDMEELCSRNGQCDTNSTSWFCICDQFYEGTLSAVLAIDLFIYLQHLLID